MWTKVATVSCGVQLVLVILKFHFFQDTTNCYPLVKGSTSANCTLKPHEHYRTVPALFLKPHTAVAVGHVVPQGVPLPHPQLPRTSNCTLTAWL